MATAEEEKARRRVLVENGICTSCGHRDAIRTVRCDECHAKHLARRRVANQRRRDQAKKGRICAKCGRRRGLRRLRRPGGGRNALWCKSCVVRQRLYRNPYCPCGNRREHFLYKHCRPCIKMFGYTHGSGPAVLGFMRHLGRAADVYEVAKETGYSTRNVLRMLQLLGRLGLVEREEPEGPGRRAFYRMVSSAVEVTHEEAEDVDE